MGTQSFDAQSDGHGRVYQQNSGAQINAENAYFADTTAPIPILVDEIEKWQRVRDLDALELGVHRAAVANGSAVPTYIARDFDQELRARVQGASGLILLVGPSTAGKTRAGYEAIQAELPDLPIFAPDNQAELRLGLAQSLLAQQRCVIWLDDLERFLGEEGLTPRLISLARSANVILFATMRSQQYAMMRTIEVSEDDPHQHSLTNAAHVLQGVVPIQVQRKWSSEELERANDVDDSRVARALDYAELYGVAEYLAAGPDLLDLWKMGDSSGNPRGQALVAAAIDITRAGLGGPIPIGLVREAHEGYLTAAGGPLLRAETFEKAVRWATVRRGGVTSLLVPTGTEEHYRPFDYLVDHVTNEAAAVPDWIWPLVHNHVRSSPSDITSVAIAAVRNKRSDFAEEVLLDYATNGDGDAAFEYARFLLARDRKSDSETWLRAAVQGGHPGAEIQLAMVLRALGKSGESIELLRARAESGDSHAAGHLADLLREDGSLAEAEHWYKLASVDDADLSVGLADVIAELGRTDEAIDILRRISDESSDAANLLGVLMIREDQAEEAGLWWEKAANLGNAMALANLGRWHMVREEYSKAEERTRAALDSGLPGVRAQLAEVLIAQGNVADGVAYLESDAAEGDAYASLGLANYYLAQGDRDWEEVERLLRVAVEEKDGPQAPAMYVLGCELVERGSPDEGEALLVDAAAAGSKSAHHRLGQLAQDRGDYGDAVDHLRIVADHDPIAACELGMVLLDLEEVEEAVEYLSLSFTKGHAHAGCNLGAILIENGSVEDGIAVWEKAYELGHEHAAARMANYYAQTGQGKKAASWLGLAQGRKPPTKSSSKKRKKRKRPGRR